MLDEHQELETYTPPSIQEVEEYENIDYLLEEASNWQYWYEDSE